MFSSYINSFLDNPKAMLIMLLLALPGRLMAISAHEFGHAYVANKCGDPTAKYMGRMTLNPLRHLDVMGTLMMVLVGFGWAKPVPVNPRNFRNMRKDDLKVSLAGITMNVLLFLLGCIIMYIIVGFALSQAAGSAIGSAHFISQYGGETCFFAEAAGGGYNYMPMSYLLENAPYLGDYIIAPVFGEIAGYLYQMLMYFVITNLVLAIFNLIPVPPLDGYHVVNDLIVKRSLFASPRASQISTAVLFILMLTGVTSTVIGFLRDLAFSGAGAAAGAIFRALGIF